MNTITTTKLNLPFRISIALYIISVLFDLMYWPFHKELVLVSVVGILLFYSFRFNNKRIKKRIDHIKFLFVILWCFNAINNSHYLIYLSPFFGFLPYSILFWLILTKSVSYTQLFGELRLKKAGKWIYTFIFFIATLCIFMGVLFKTTHWPYASIMLIIGLSAFSLIVIIDYFIRDYPIDQDEINEIGKH